MKRRYPFVWIAIAFSIGILWHGSCNKLFFGISFLIIFFLSAAYYCRRSKFFSVFILLVFVCLGWVSSHSRWMFAEDHIYFRKKEFLFSQMTVRGIVASDVRRSETGYAKRLSCVVMLKEVKIDEKWQPVSGKIIVNLFRDESLVYGDDIVLQGKPHAPFEFSSNSKFSYRQYLGRQGIYFVLSVKKATPIEILRRNRGHPVMARLLNCRHFASDVISKYLPQYEAAIIQAILLGERLNIPDFLKDIFTKTGTAHILAISGLNVGIVVAVVFLVLRMLPGPMVMTYGLTMVFIILYVLLTGASPSVVRAGIMSTVFLTSFMIERETDSMNSLGFAAFLLLIIDPQDLFDIGFQLSFISVLSILLFYPQLMKFFELFLKKHPNFVMKFLIESFAVSLAATLGVAGLIAYYFNIVTPISLIANIFVVPLSTLALILGIGMLGCSWLALLFAISIQLVLNLMVWVMSVCQHVPGAYIYLKAVNAWGIVSYYLFVVFLWLLFEEIQVISGKTAAD